MLSSSHRFKVTEYDFAIQGKMGAKTNKPKLINRYTQKEDESRLVIN